MQNKVDKQSFLSDTPVIMPVMFTRSQMEFDERFSIAWYPSCCQPSSFSKQNNIYQMSFSTKDWKWTTLLIEQWCSFPTILWCQDKGTHTYTNTRIHFRQASIRFSIKSTEKNLVGLELQKILANGTKLEVI